MSDRKITVVTAVYNGEEYIERCLRSIMNQTYKNYEHIVMDGGSTDRTVEIVKKYEALYNVKIYSKKDNGMYDAIANGFDLATGDIYCWLNSDDMFMPWAFEVMNCVMTKTDAQWCMGFPSFWTENDVSYCLYRLSGYRRTFIKRGYHDGRILPFLEQESTFWTRDLWNRANGSMIRDYTAAGDFQLWKRFAQYEPLYTVNSMISGFRRHPGQKSANRVKYYAEVGNNSIFKKFLAATKCLMFFDVLFSGFTFKRKEKLFLQRFY